jgi:NAD(P)-dependent dehydrogenase (short-subunit alcohol dehydrogenase family)
VSGIVAGKVAIVTGAGRGIGRGIALAMAREGGRVVVCDIGASLEGAGTDPSPAHEVVDEIKRGGGEAIASTLSIVEPKNAEEIVKAALAAFGRVDVLVNNAGVGTAVPATRETPEQFRSVVDINLHGSYWAAQACARVMRPGSSIVNISSILALTTAGLPQAAYSASKAAVIGLTRDLAQQWGSRKGIRVNAIAPGFFESEMTGQYKPGYVESLTPRVLLQRMGDPMELAATLVWLASDAGGFVTGQTIVVDGGVSIT